MVTIEDYIELIRDSNSYEFKLLERMYPFFNGEFNHHDIMMISNCTIGDLERMLDTYNAVLDKFVMK